MIKYKHYDNDEQVDTDYEFWYDVDGERIGKCKRIRGSFSVPVVRGSSQETEEFTFYLRDEEGNVMSEFRSNFCPSEQTPFLSQSAFLAKENNFYFGGKIKATEKIEGYNNQNCPIWNFYHQDHLGNTRVITDDQGNVIAEHKYFPYGEELTSHTQDTLNHRFTGHERDFESNLDYMMARYYSSFMRRFLSVDRFKGIKGLAQSLNRYSYVLNNPIIYNDPSGNIVPWFFAPPGGNIWDTIMQEWTLLPSHVEEKNETKEINIEDIKEGDIIYRVGPNGETDSARADGRDENGNLLIFAFDSKTNKVDLVPLGSKRDKFGKYTIVGHYDPIKKFGYFAISWQEAMQKFAKYQGKEWGYGENQLQCFELTTCMTFREGIDWTLNDVFSINNTFYKYFVENYMPLGFWWFGF